MKRYLLFSYPSYYPSGGWNDFRGDFDSVKDALVALGSIEDYNREFWHVIDSQTKERVEEKD